MSFNLLFYYCIMNDNKLKIMFGVNIAITCLGIFMIYKANKTDQQIDDSVNTYIEKKIKDELKIEVDAAVIEIKNDNTIGNLVNSSLNDTVKKITEASVTDQIKSSVTNKVNEFAKDKDIIDDVVDELMDSCSFIDAVAIKIASKIVVAK